VEFLELNQICEWAERRGLQQKGALEFVFPELTEHPRRPYGIRSGCRSGRRPWRVGRVLVVDPFMGGRRARIGPSSTPGVLPWGRMRAKISH